MMRVGNAQRRRDQYLPLSCTGVVRCVDWSCGVGVKVNEPVPDAVPAIA